MQRMIKLLFIALCLLLLGQGEAQDVQPELPEDFPSATTELITTSSDVPVTELIPTTEGTTIRATTTEPSSTEPPLTEPPITEPPITEPPSTEPPITEPPITEPPITEPPITEPPITEPPITEPPSTEPPITEPPATTQSTPMTESTTVASPYPPYWPTQPVYSTTTSSTNEDEDEWSEPMRCYLREIDNYGRWGYRGCFWYAYRPSVSCYNCCYYGLNTFAGCSKVFEGGCGYQYDAFSGLHYGYGK